MSERQLLAGSPDRFGFEWDRYSEIHPESRGQLQRWLGSVPLERFAGMTVMDVGCGMGRNPYWMANAGARRVLAVDVDDRSLAAARRNLTQTPNVEVRRLSVYALDPITAGSFDIVTCIGVLHHLEDPVDALKHMWECVKPGGALFLWCYAREGNRAFLPLIQGMRVLGSRLPIGVVHAMARMIGRMAWPFIRVLPFRNSYYRSLRTLSFSNFESIVFDQMLPRIAHYWSRRDIDALIALLPAGVPDIQFVQGNSWSVRVTKHANAPVGTR